MAAQKRAITSVVIGDAYSELWRRYARDSWLTYASKFGLEVVVFEEPLDRSVRARNRSPAWQKLLLLEHPSLARFERVVYMDADVIINAAEARLVFEGVPDEKIGATVDMSFISHPLFAAEFLRLCGQPGMAERSRQLYAKCGLSPLWDFVVNTGVWVASPQRHARLLRRVYDECEETPDSYYEQVFLSHRIIENHLLHMIDPRYNVLWYEFIDGVYDFLHGPHEPLKALALASVFRKSYFLHFAAEQEDMTYLLT